jgi:hypothetical protein
MAKQKTVIETGLKRFAPYVKYQPWSLAVEVNNGRINIVSTAYATEGVIENVPTAAHARALADALNRAADDAEGGE